MPQKYTIAQIALVSIVLGHNSEYACEKVYSYLR